MRIQIPALALAAALLGGAAAHAQCQTYSGLTYATYQDADGQTRPLQLDLLVPTGLAEPAPVVVWIHGGGWFSGSRSPIPAEVSALCSQGYAVASIDYRLTGTAVWPAQIQDCKGAVRWLRAHAGTYNLDPDRVAAWGSSAGGHLASMLGTAGGVGAVTLGNETVDLEGSVGGNLGRSSRVQAAVHWYGQTDFLQMRFYPTTQDHDANGSPESKLVGDWIQRVPERVATASPLTFASPDDPPFLVMHGTLDDLVPFHQSELLVETLRRQGVRVTWRPVPGAGHGGSSFNTAASYQAVYDFLSRELRDVPAVTVSVTAPDASAAESGGTATFRVSRTGATSSPLTVHWVPAGTARIGVDYTLAAPWSITIPAGASSATLTLTPLQDDRVEGSETAELRLAADPAYRIDAARAVAAATLADGNGSAGLPEVTVTASDSSATEVGEEGASFLVEADPPPAADLRVRYALEGTATHGEDYAALSGEALIPAGAASVEVPVAVLADTVLEPSETVFLSLQPAAGYRVGSPPRAGAWIAEAGAASTLPVVSISATAPEASESGLAGAFAVTRTGSTVSSLSVDLVVGGSAREGSDYVSLPGTVAFGAGESRLPVSITPWNDALAEGPEAVTLAVAAEPAVLLGAGAGSRVTIADDELTDPEGFYALPPCRLVDTRGPAGPWGAPRLTAGEVRVFELAGRCGIPPEASAVALNVTVASPDGQGHLTLFETGAPRPTVSTINFAAGPNRANNAIVPLTGAPRSLAVHPYVVEGGGCDLVLDVTGYFR